MERIKRQWKLILGVVVACFLLGAVLLNMRPHQVNIEQKITSTYGISDPRFLHSMSHILHIPFIDGNKVEAFQNGNAIFPAMLEAIRKAEHSITFETFIYWSGDISNQFTKALIERAQKGVKVHVLFDWVGSEKIDKTHIEALRQAGAEVEFYHPLHWYNIFRMNSRTHRKILVVDGKIGFTGGVGIKDEWNGNGDQPQIWRDSHYKITGPAASYLQAGFMDNWLKTRPEVLITENYFPFVKKAGAVPAQFFISSPSEGGASMRLMYLMIIAATQKTLRIASAYFVPDEVTIREIIKAHKRGVRVQILVPGEYTDSQLVLSASREIWGDLLKEGIEMHAFQPAMFHMKILIADDLLVSVGSTNFDDRSFRLNTEANLNIYDEIFAKQQIAIFNQDLAQSKPYTYDVWLNRTWFQKLRGKVFSLFQDQL